MASAAIVPSVDFTQNLSNSDLTNWKLGGLNRDADSADVHRIERTAAQQSISRQNSRLVEPSLVIDEGQRTSLQANSSDHLNNNAREHSVIEFPHVFQRRQIENRSVNTLQEWEGLIETVDGDTFTARLRDLTSAGRAEEQAVIPLSEIDRSDHLRVQPGALFHLIIGFVRRGGSQRRETFTYFRRHMPSQSSAASDLANLLTSFSEGD